MDYTDLQVLAEVSVALLGFSGITVVMGHSQFDQQGVAYRTRGLIFSSSMAFIGSIMPLVGVPIMLAAAVMAAAMSALCVWAGRTILGKNTETVPTNPMLTWTLLPVTAVSSLALWFSIFVYAENILFIYKLSIGCNLLLAVVAFVRLLTSALSTQDISNDS